jgi:hypothetical protein
MPSERDKASGKTVLAWLMIGAAAALAVLLVVLGGVANLCEWLFTAGVVACLLRPCLFYFRGRLSTLIAAIVVGLTLAPCYWLTLFDPNWNGWVPSARVTTMLVMNGLLGDSQLDFYLQPSWWIGMAVTAVIAFVLIENAKKKHNALKEITDNQGLPPVF